VTCTSFSASAKVEDDTSGPAGGEVPKAGGAPGVDPAVFCAVPRQPAAAPSAASVEYFKNRLREFDMVFSERQWL
jgi:hypothetical protein